jgi:hypothetical protein
LKVASVALAFETDVWLFNAETHAIVAGFGEGGATQPRHGAIAAMHIVFN